MNKWDADVFSEVHTCIDKLYQKLSTACILAVIHFSLFQLNALYTYVQYIYIISICIERIIYIQLE